MGKGANRRKTRAVKEQSAKGMGQSVKNRKEKYPLPSDPAEGIYVTYEMMGPDTKAVIDRMFRDRSRAEHIANL